MAAIIGRLYPSVEAFIGTTRDIFRSRKLKTPIGEPHFIAEKDKMGL